jgi:hypothetical protein
MKKNNFKSLAAVLSLAMAATALPVNANAAAAPKLTVSASKVYSKQTYSMTVKNLKKGYTVQFSSTDGGVNFKSKKVTSKGAKVTGKFTVKAAKQIADGSTTKIKAVVKNESGKKVATLSKKVTLKQLANTLTVKDIADTTVTVGATVNADATIAPAAAKGAYKKTFTSSDSSVLKVTNASNGLFEAVAPGTATISVTATNDDGKVVEGSKNITITVVAAQSDATLTPSDTTTTPDPIVTPDEVPTTTGTSVTTDVAITTDFKLELEAESTGLVADSKSQTKINITLTAPDSYTSDKTMKVTAQLVLGTTGIGTLSQEDVTLVYQEDTKKWTGQVTFTSATLTTATKSTIKATISRVVDGPDEQIVGLNSNEVGLTLTPATAVADTTVAVKAIKAEVISNDRINITFNQPVSADSFLTYEGKVANGDNADKKGDTIIQAGTPAAEAFRLYLKQNATEKDTDVDGINYAKCVEAVLPVSGSNDTLTFVLKNDASVIFKDNSKFLLQFVDRHTGSDQTSDVVSNYITDTTTPTIMSVEEVSKRQIKVTFDQPVVSDTVSSSAIGPNNIRSALNPSNYAIDGYNLGTNNTNEFYYTKDGVEYSLFGTKVTIEPADTVARNAVIITLGETSKAGNKGNVYFEATSHVITVSNVGDYASLSETNNNNAIVSKTLDFSIKNNTSAPDVKVEAQSPEQYIISFTTAINELNGVGVGTELTSAKITELGLALHYKDTKDNVTAWTDVSTALGQGIKVTRIDDVDGKPRLKMEVTNDWTTLAGYKDKDKLYHNYSLAIAINAANVTNSDNGIKMGTAVVDRPLTSSQVTAYDGDSPTLTTVNPVTDLSSNSVFDLVFSEPVQGANTVFDDEYGYAITPGYSKILNRAEQLSDISVKIVSNSDSKVYEANIQGYGSLEDNVIRIQTQTLAAGKYTLYATGVSDDAGNTAKTISYEFEVPGVTVADEVFKVYSIFADMNYDDGLGTAKLDSYKGNTGRDAIYVEFSSTPSSAPLATSVLNTANWTINGAALPVGSQIISGVVNNGQTVGNSVTIILPDGTLTDVGATSVKLSQNVINNNTTKAVTLTGKTTFATQSIFVGSKYASGNEFTATEYDLTTDKWADVPNTDLQENKN